jgi:hypothetical protein
MAKADSTVRRASSDNESSDNEIPDETKKPHQKHRRFTLQVFKAFNPGSSEARDLPDTPGCRGGSRKTLSTSPHIAKPGPPLQQLSGHMHATQLPLRHEEWTNSRDEEKDAPTERVSFETCAVHPLRPPPLPPTSFADTASSSPPEPKDSKPKPAGQVDKLRKSLFSAT